MIFNRNQINIAYIGGGSFDFGWKFIGEICQVKGLSGVVRLYDVNEKHSVLNETIGNNLKSMSECKTDMIFLCVDTLEEALRNADFVVISIFPGEYSMVVNDFEICDNYDIYQVSGEAGGPVGFMRGLRTLPDYVTIASQIKSICSDAWVISMSEPMSACVEMLYKVFPDIKAIGCANDTFASKELLGDMVCERYNVSDVSIRDIKANLIGINKFCFMDNVMYKNDNLFNLYADNAKKYAHTGYEGKKQFVKFNPSSSLHRVQFDLFARYGVIPASADRYLAESCPPWYITTKKASELWKIGSFSKTYAKRKVALQTAMCKKYIDNKDTLRIGWSGTDCVAIIRSIMGQGNLVTNAITINKGQVANLPENCAVETNVLFSCQSIKPVFAGSVPKDIKILMDRIVGNTDFLVDAVFNRNIDEAFNVFVNDPLITLDMVTAKHLYRDLIKSNKDYMDYYLV